MDRIERIGPREPQWLKPALDGVGDDTAERDRRRREQERRRRQEHARDEDNTARPEGDDPPHHIDVRA